MAIRNPKTSKSVKETAAETAKAAPKMEDQSAAVEQEQEQEEEEEQETGTEVVETTGTAMAAATGTGLMAGNNADDDGFGALDDQIGFGSFPIMKLDKTHFVVDNEEIAEFQCVMHSSREKYLFKVKEGEDEDIVYSYDGVNDTGGNPLTNKFEEWREEGFTSEPSKVMYIEVVAEIRDENLKCNGGLVLLSIPPASIKRLAGYRATLKLKRKRMDAVITKCKLGPKIQVNSKVSFNPWDFVMVSDV